MRQFAILLAAVMALCGHTQHAHAETYCITNAAQLGTALSNAAGSPGASEIRVRQGFYVFPAGGANGYALNYSGTSDLTISGGWSGSNNTCTVDGALEATTVLSADGAGRLLNIFIFAGFDTAIEIRNLSFREGDAGNTGLGGCLHIESDAGANATVNIDNNSFRLCRSTGVGSALVVRARSMDLRMRNNVFADNVSQLGVVRISGLGGSLIFISNNTLANNPQIDLDGGPGGMQINAQPSDLIYFTNNVMWKNGSTNGYDLLVNGNIPIILNNNLIGAMAPLAASIPNNNTLSIDPGFTSVVDFRPRADSPIRNSGVGPGGGATTLDIAAQLRVQGGRIDRGAYEFVELFSNGFE